MLSLLLASALAQVPESPETALVYSGTPQVVAMPDAKGNRAVIDLQWHTVTMNLEKETAFVRCVSLFKNNSNQPVEAEVRIPVNVRGWSTNFGTGLKVLWADAAATPIKPINEPDRMAGDMKMATRWFVYKVSFRPQAQRSLKTEMTLPIQFTGPDGMERQVAYLFDRTPSPLETMSLAIKYSPQLVYRTIEASPKNWNWEVGARGAFMKREDASLLSPTLATFRYYRGGFDKIGDGG